MAGSTGRPKLPAEERRDHYLRIRVSELELGQIKEAAKLLKQRPTTWARRLLLEEAERLRRR